MDKYHRMAAAKTSSKLFRLDPAFIILFKSPLLPPSEETSRKVPAATTSPIVKTLVILPFSTPTLKK